MVAAISCLFATSLPAAEPAGLSALTYSGEQHALTALDREIVAAGKDPARLAALATELLAVLRQSDASFAARQAAAQRLGRVLAPADTPDTEKALKPLRAMLIDERDSDLARLALEPVPGGTCDRLFMQSLEPTSGRTRLGILDSIARRRIAAAVPEVSKLLRDSDSATVAAAAHALAEIGTPAAVAALHALPEPSAAPMAAAKLTVAPRLPPAAALGLLDELQRRARDPVHRAAAFRQALDVEVGTAATRIASVLGGRDWGMKQVALEALSTSRAPNLIATLAAKLSGWVPPTQRAVIAALGRRRDGSATPAILSAVKHKDAEVRAGAITALGFLPGSRDTALLLGQLAADSESDDARRARQSLARLDGPDVAATILAGAERGDARGRAVFLDQLALRHMTEGVPILLQARHDPDAAVRLAAVAALGEIAPLSERQALLDWTLHATDEAEQARALRSLVNVILRDPDVGRRGEILYTAIERAPAAVASRLLPALARIGDQASAETAARLAVRDDRELAAAAMASLTHWPDASALPALAKVANEAVRAETRTAAVDGVLDHFMRNRDPWSGESTAVVTRLLSSRQEPETGRKLLALLHRANDDGALALAERLKSDTALASAATTAADVVRANRAGPPKLRASTPAGLANVLDGKTNTRWSTPALGEEWIEIDFMLSRPIETVTLDQTGRAAEFPERFEAYVTDDPTRPGEALASGPGERAKTVIRFPTGTRGRYLVLKNVAERSEMPWTICELYVD